MKNYYRKLNSRKLSLGEMIEIVGSCARNSRETLAALADLFESGRVMVSSQGRLKRVKLAVAK
jgi:hypothetical protein